MMGRIRRLAGFATTAALLGLLSLTPALPVSALDQAANTIRVTENQTVEKDFGPIAAAEPLPGVPAPAPKLNTPDACKQATYCDLIPLEVVLPPTLRPSDEFFVTVGLEWTTQSLPGTADTPSPRTSTTSISTCGTTPRPTSRSSRRPPPPSPEQLRLFRPTKGKYSIVVFNYVGPNTGYKLKVSYKPEKIVPPFESLAPDFNPVATPPAPPRRSTCRSRRRDVADRQLRRGGHRPRPRRRPRRAGGRPGPADPGGRRLRPRLHELRRRRLRPATGRPDHRRPDREAGQAVGPPKPASTSSLVFWLAIVPLLLVAAAGFWLSKKGSAVLKLR